MNEIFSPAHRIGRVNFILTKGIAGALLIPVGYGIGVLRSMSMDAKKEIFVMPAQFVLAIAALALFWVIYAAIVKRCHDVGLSAWRVILLLIPIVNLIFMIYLYAKPGETGPNRYGI